MIEKIIFALLLTIKFYNLYNWQGFNIISQKYLFCWNQLLIEMFVFIQNETI